MTNASDNHHSPRQRYRRLVSTGCRKGGRFTGKDRARTTRKSPQQSWCTIIYASRWHGARTQKSVQTQGVFSVLKGIADTGFLVAFANRNDDYHNWALTVASRVDEPLLTCEAVLAESAFHLRNVPLILSMIRDGLISLAFECQDHFPRLVALASRYGDRRPDLADLCLVCMSELYPRHSVITIDDTDFRIYRRNKREAIPLICPPRR